MPPKRKAASKASKKTAKFLIALSKSRKLQEAWAKDHMKAMKKAGLSPAAIKALKSRSPRKIAKHLGDDAPPGCFILVAII